MDVTSLPASALLAARIQAWRAWAQSDPKAKCEATQQLAAWPGRIASADSPRPTARGLDGGWAISEQDCIEFEQALANPPLRPGRPLKPRLVHPRQVPDRGVGSELGRAALLHAIAHIEFNAIDLALDAIWRFPAQPASWVIDWMNVALDEARHFTMLQSELRRRGYEYGDFEAHDGLWEMALRTRDDVLVRVALVPRLLEARGLDVTPRIIERLRGAGDLRAIAILEVILREEVAHVAIGNAWFHRLCEARGLDARIAWDALAQAQAVSPPVPPFNRVARLKAGFEESELQRWELHAQSARL